MENQIIELLKKASDSYYNKGNFLEMSDEEVKLVYSFVVAHPYKRNIDDTLFDVIYSTAKDTWPNNDFFKTIGANISTDTYGKTIKLKNIAGSLNELKEGNWDKWSQKNKVYCVMSKLDGMSCVITYKNGILIQAVTRGDGFEGKDILRNVIKIKNIPHRISLTSEIEIRGELIVRKEKTEYVLKSLRDFYKEPDKYKNARNTVSAGFGGKEVNELLSQFTNFVAYEIKTDENKIKKEEELSILKILGFEIPNYIICSNIDEQFLINRVKWTKSNDAYECDGLVVTLNEYDINYDGYESNGLNPKNSRKFKLGAENNSAETIVRDIKWNISKDGFLKPVVYFDPVDIQGVTISKASGYNYRFVKEMKLGVGAKIKLIRSGDVIPKIINTIDGNDNIVLPTENYHINEDGVEAIIDDMNNLEIKQKSIIYFCNAIDVEQAGKGNIALLGINSIEELLILKKEYYDEKIGINGIKLYDSLWDILSKISEIKFMDAVCAFGRGIGESKLEEVWNKYKTLNIFSEEKLKIVNNFGETSIRQYLENKNNYDYWKSLMIKYNIGSNQQITNISSDKYKDYNVVFTGIRDGEMEKCIINNGGKISNSINKDVNLLIAKDPLTISGKVKKATDLNIKIINYNDAKEIFK